MKTHLIWVVALFFSLPVFSQTTFAGFVNQDWHNAANWTNGLPGPSNNALVPGGVQAIISQTGYVTNFDIESFGTITFQTATTLEGKLTNSGTLLLNNDVLANDDLINFGTLVVPVSRKLELKKVFNTSNVLEVRGTLIYQGTTGIWGGNLLNTGTTEIRAGQVTITSTWQNQGSFTVNAGANWTIENGAVFYNLATATSNGNLTIGGTLRNEKTFTSNGLITLTVRIENQKGGVFNNNGPLNSTGRIFNTAVFNNQGLGNIFSDFKIFNDSIWNNTGRLFLGDQFENRANASFFNLAPGKVINDFGSTINNLGTWENRAALRNDGTLDNVARFFNFDSLSNNISGQILNKKLLENRGLILNSDKFFNDDQLVNFSRINNLSGGQLVNNDTLINETAGTISNLFEVYNNEVLLNKGQFTSSVRVFNADRWFNQNRVSNIGNFFNQNLAQFTNLQIFENIEGGILVNEGGFINRPGAVINNNKCGELILRTNLTNESTINNRSIVYNRPAIQGGTFVDDTGYLLNFTDSVAPVLCKPGTVGLKQDGTLKAYGTSVSPLFDSCGSLILRLNDKDTIKYTCAQIGTYDVKFSLTDRLGNRKVCFTTLTITDALGPKFNNCPKDTTILSFNGTGTSFTWAPVTATDNCGTVRNITSNFQPGATFPIGITEVLYNAVDDRNNPSECRFKVTVESQCNKSVLLVVGNLTLNTGDLAIKNRLELLGYTVTLKKDNQVQAADATNKTFVFISSTVLAANIGTRLTEVTVPVINSEPFSYSDFKMTSGWEGVDYGTATTNCLAVNNSNHPLAAGYSGLVYFQNPTTEIGWGKAPATATTIARVSGSSSRAMIFMFPKGATMSGNYKAPETRIAFFLRDHTAANLNYHGWNLFDAAVQSITTGCTTSPCTSTGKILAEEWYNLPGYNIADIPVQKPADFVRPLQALELPVNSNDRFGARIRGNFCAPQTGFYTFWLASDDFGELYLSTDDKSTNKKLIANVPGWTNPREWSKYPQQRSIQIFLIKNQSYYLEALVKEHEGGNHLAVACQLPDGNFLTPIPAAYFTPAAGLVATPVCTATGNFTREVWFNINSFDLNQIPVNTTPALRRNITRLEYTGNEYDYYGERLRGYLCAPVTGQFTFWIASDDHSALFLSTDDNPANKQKIAFVDGWTDPGQFNKFASQKSVSITLQANTRYYLEVLHLDGHSGDHVSVGWTLPNGTFEATIPANRLSAIPNLADINPPADCSATGLILREIWTNVSGTSLSQVPLHTAANIRDHLTQFEMSADQMDNYAARISGYLCPPFTGWYTFWISSDDNGALWLSTDDKPSNKRRIAHVPGYTGFREWNKYSEQRSVAIYLQAKKRYYIEAQMKEGFGGDNLSVAWYMPNGQYEVPIKGANLAPWNGNAGSREALLSLDAQLHQNKVNLSWIVNNDEEAASYIVQRSTDPNQGFETIQTVDAKDLAGAVLFQHQDDQAPRGSIHYRIIQILKDGSENYSEIKQVQIVIDLDAVTAFPNPTTGDVYLNLGTYEGRSVQIIVNDALGRIIRNIQLDRAEKDPYFLNLSDFHDGTYTVSIIPQNSRLITLPVVLIRP